MNDLVTVFADLHAHNFKKFARTEGGINSRLMDACRVLESINEFNKKNKIKSTLFAGDLFHAFAAVENDVLNLVGQVLEKWEGEFVFIHGNHDTKVKDGHGKVFVGSAIFERFDGLRCVYLDKEKYELAAGPTVYGIGWRKPNQFLEMADKFIPADIFLGHQLVANPYIKDLGLLLPPQMTQYKFMVFGDFHKPYYHKDSKLLIPGATHQHRFDDEGQRRGFWALNPKTWTAEFIPIDFTPKFVTVSYAKEVSNPNDFYRVEEISKEQLPPNAIAQPDIKADFRESGLSAEMTDEALVAEYIKIAGGIPAGVDNKVVMDVGMTLLRGCETRSIKPKDWKLVYMMAANFMSLRGVHEFNLEDGLHLVSGDNGVGKTTIFEAINWGIHGTTTKGMSADDVVCDDEGKDCRVKLRFRNPAGAVLDVMRYRKHAENGNDFLFRVTGVKDEDDRTVQRENTDVTREELYQELGTNEGFFKNVNYFSQEEFEFFSTMTDAGQKALCKNIRQIDRFELAEEKARVVESKAGEQFDTLNETVGACAASISAAGYHIAELEKVSAVWVKDRVDQIGLKKEALASTSKIIAEAEKKIEILAEEKIEFEKEKKARVIVSHTVEEEAVKVIQSDMLRNAEDYGKLLAEYDGKIALLKSEKTVKKDYRHDRDGQLAVLQRALVPLQQEITKIEIAKCPLGLGACDKVNANKVAELVGERKQKIEVIEKDVEKITAEIQAADQQLQELEPKIAKAERRKEVAIEVDREERQALEQKLTGAQNKLALATAGEKEQARKDASVEQELESKMSSLRQTVSSSEERYRELKNEIQKLEIAKNDAAERAALERGNLSGLRITLAQVIEKRTAASADQDMARYWIRGFSNQGLVSYLLDGFAKRFTEMANDALLDLSAGRYSVMLSTQKKLRGKEEWREKFEFIVFVDGKKRSYKALSGGQKARINLATVVALNGIIQEQYGIAFHPFGILILDELITDLDAEGVEAVYDVLERFAVDNAVYAVTHIDSFKSMFASYINVEYDKDLKSTVIKGGADE